MPFPTPISILGFLGLGVMGEPMCGHLAKAPCQASRSWPMTSAPSRWNGWPRPTR